MAYLALFILRRFLILILLWCLNFGNCPTLMFPLRSLSIPVATENILKVMHWWNNVRPFPNRWSHLPPSVEVCKSTHLSFYFLSLVRVIRFEYCNISGYIIINFLVFLNFFAFSTIDQSEYIFSVFLCDVGLVRFLDIGSCYVFVTCLAPFAI